MLPSVPGYGFSGEPTELGWGIARTAQAWAELMRRLGYARYVAQGGDVGALVTDMLGRQAPAGLAGIHINLLGAALAIADKLPKESEQERAALDALAMFRASGFGYYLEQATRPQTIGYALLDSPVALAAWMLDHDTDSYYKVAARVHRRQALGWSHPRPRPRQHHDVLADGHRRLGGPRVLGERPGAGARGRTGSSARLCSRSAFTTFPDEIFAGTTQLGKAVVPTLIYFNEAARGGHFAAWEEPDLFSAEMRAAFRPLRSES